jgi:hypothetical protein
MNIDRIVITDHNTIAGALLAQEIEPQRVIIGEEIMTTKGELLAAFVKEEVPAGLEPRQAIEILRNQGAFISVSHPFDRMRSGHWELSDLLETSTQVDAIEVFNARCVSPKFNDQAKSFAKENTLPGTVGSDAHTISELGKAVMVLPDFYNAIGLRAIIDKAQFETTLSAPWIHFTSRYAVWYKKLTAR